MRRVHVPALIAAAWMMTACELQQVDAAGTTSTAVQALSVETLSALEDFDIEVEGPVAHTWEGVQIDNGQTIRVVANNATNGLLPEGDATGYARGRWSWLILTRTE